MKTALLTSRGVVRITGADAQDWLQGLITNDIARADASQACFAALLSPQGKILFDFLVHRRDKTFLLDCAADQAAALARRLGMYRLRAKVEATQEADFGVAAIWDTDTRPHPLALRDPRHPGLGWRVLDDQAALSRLVAPGAGESEYAAHRIALGIPEGGMDFSWNDIFPHDADMDELGGVDFKKGCYVGQEVVSRVQHRGTARKRFRPVTFPAQTPAQGTDILAGENLVGTIATISGQAGLALFRIDRLMEALEAGHSLEAGGHAVLPVTTREK